MSDIVVTTPKNRMAEAAAEAEAVEHGDAKYYFRDYRKPPPVSPDDRVYYVEDGFVRGFCLAAGVLAHRNGTHRMYMHAKTWKWIKPIPMKGFQNWRYAPWGRGAVQIVGNWLDPKPEIAA